MKGSGRDPLLRSIVLVLICYWSLETLGFLFIGRAHKFPDSTIRLFLLTQVVFHIGLAFFLFLSRNFFYIEATGVRLKKVNIANKITMLRVSMLPSILFLILSVRDFDIAPILMGALAITFITDMIDGRLSRARNEVTHIGRILDSVSDYSLLIVIAVAYRFFGLLPKWLFFIIFLRLMLHALGMFAVLVIRGKVEPQPTYFGKVAIATMMSLFALEALKLVLPAKSLGFFAYIEIAAGIVVGASMLDKFYYFFKQARNKTNRRGARND